MKKKKTKAKLRGNEKVIGASVPKEALNQKRLKKLGTLKKRDLE